MLLLNFSHPLTPDQLARVEELSGQGVERVIEAPAQFDHARPFAEQVAALADHVGLSPAEWQTSPLLVVPPSLNFIAVALLAELHGRCGYFPAHLRLRPAEGSGPTRYEVAEVMNLQTIREAARLRRRDEPSD